MKIQLIRNATLKLRYADQIILVDPMLLPKYSYDSLAGKSRNPTVDLPISTEEVLDGIDMVLVTHTHRDHFDTLAIEKLDKSLPLFCQPADRELMRNNGFVNSEAIES